MDDQTANKLDRLLAGDGISGPEADAIFTRVVAEVEREEGTRSWTRVLWGGAAALGLAAAAALIAVRPDPAPAGFAARGGAETGPRLEVICADGSLAACPISSRLIFAVSGDATTGFLSAYAEPLEPGAERVWYFARESQSPELAGVANGTRVFEQAVQLVGSHQRGRYRVHAFLADAALGQDEMLANPSGQARATVHAELHIIGE